MDEKIVCNSAIELVFNVVNYLALNGETKINYVLGST
jgi:hypothetical protein